MFPMCTCGRSEYARQEGESNPSRLGTEASASRSHCTTTSRGITWLVGAADIGALATQASQR
eukprot:scaffold12911_cov67-Phaeocystis_antarctica.AAC.2